MKTIEELVNVLKTEADLSEALLAVIEEKQNALVHFKVDDVAAAVERERKLLKPIQELERERSEIVENLASEVEELRGRTQRCTIHELAGHMEGEVARRIIGLAQRIRSTGQRIQRRNQQNNVLLESSARFVKNTLRILTEDYSRQLVDQKV
jgi:flagellar biosynthesis/type III secretory pathway chaperone